MKISCIPRLATLTCAIIQINTCFALNIGDEVRIINIENQNSLRHANSLISEVKLNDSTRELDVLDSTFYLRKGLAGKCYSFESKNYPSYYIKPSDSRLMISKIDETNAFQKDATFCLESDQQLKSYSNPSHIVEINENGEAHISSIDSNIQGYKDLRAFHACWNGTTGQFGELSGNSALDKACEAQFGIGSEMTSAGSSSYTCTLPNKQKELIYYNNCLSDISQFLLESGWQTYDYLKNLTGNNDRNTLIVELHIRSGRSLETLQSTNNEDLLEYAKKILRSNPEKHTKFRLGDVRDLQACWNGTTGQFGNKSGNDSLDSACATQFGVGSEMIRAGQTRYVCSLVNGQEKIIEYKKCLTDISNFLIETGWRKYTDVDLLPEEEQRNSLIYEVASRSENTIEFLKRQSNNVLLAYADKLKTTVPYNYRWSVLPSSDNGDCAVVTLDGTLIPENCEANYNYTCWNSQLDTWKITKNSGAWRRGYNQCRIEFGKNFSFSIPNYFYSFDKLSENSNFSSNLWVNLTDQTANQNWESWNMFQFENLLKNPSGESGNLNGWQVSNDYEWGIKEYNNDTGFYYKKNDKKSNKTQIVNLYDKGWTDHELDKQPFLAAEQHYILETGSDINVCLDIELLDNNKNILDTSSDCILKQNNTGKTIIERNLITIPKIPKGIRYIRWKDTIKKGNQIGLDQAKLRLVQTKDSSTRTAETLAIDENDPVKVHSIKVVVSIAKSHQLFENWGTDKDVQFVIKSTPFCDDEDICNNVENNIGSFLLDNPNRDDFEEGNTDVFEIPVYDPLYIYNDEIEIGIGFAGNEKTIWSVDDVVYNHVKVYINGKQVINKKYNQKRFTSVKAGDLDFEHFSIDEEDLRKKIKYKVQTDKLKDYDNKVLSPKNIVIKLPNNEELLVSEDGYIETEEHEKIEIVFKSSLDKKPLLLLLPHSKSKYAPSENRLPLTLDLKAANNKLIISTKKIDDEEINLYNIINVWNTLSDSQKSIKKYIKNIDFNKSMEKVSSYITFTPGHYVYRPKYNEIAINNRKLKFFYFEDTYKHEFGHKLMHIFYNYEDYINSDCNSHISGKVIDQQCAFLEGWADFISVVLKNELTNSPSRIFKTPTGSVEKDLEIYETIGYSFNHENSKEDEGRVAAALVDLWDSHNDNRYGMTGKGDYNEGVPLNSMLKALKTLNHRKNSGKCTGKVEDDNGKLVSTCTNIRDYYCALYKTEGVHLKDEDNESLMYNKIISSEELKNINSWCK